MSTPTEQEHAAAETELARTFVADVYERYARHFVSLLLEAIGKHEAPTQALDLACGMGRAATEALAVLPEGSRIVALSDSRSWLTELHDTLPEKCRGAIFARKEAAHRLPFARSSFDLVWACTPTGVLSSPLTVMKQAMRVLRPGGKLIFCVPIAGSFLELTTLVAGVSAVDTHQMLSDRPELLSVDAWKRTLQRAGGIELATYNASFQLMVQPPPSSDRLIAMHLLPLWLGRTTEDADARQVLDRAITMPVSTTVQIAAFVAHRGQTDADTDAGADSVLDG